MGLVLHAGDGREVRQTASLPHAPFFSQFSTISGRILRALCFLLITVRQDHPVTILSQNKRS